MSSLQLSDFRAMMGKYNLGSVVISEGANGSQHLDKVNNHAHFKALRSVTPPDAVKNEQIRTVFYEAIKNDLNAKGLGERGRAFLERVRDDLLGDANRGADLSRSADVARILDELDFAVDAGDFSAPGERSLSDRFVTRRNSLTREFRVDVTELAQRVIGQVYNDLMQHNDAGVPTLDSKLVKLVAKHVGISEQRAETFLLTRKATIYSKSASFIAAEARRLGTEGANALGRQGFSHLAIANAVKELHLETQSAIAIGKLAAAPRTVASVLMGGAAVPVADWKNDLKTLLPQLAQLADGTAAEATIRFGEVEVKLCKAGELRTSATIGEAKLSLPGAATLLAMVMNAVDCAPNGAFEVADVSGLLDGAHEFIHAHGNEAKGFQRQTQVARWVLSAGANLNEVEQQGLSNRDVVEIAQRLVAGGYGTPPNSDTIRAEIAQIGNKRMYSPALLETVKTYGETNVEQVEFGEGFDAERPPVDPMNALAADLICNESVWMLDDTVDAVRGERIRQTLLKHQDALAELLADNSKLGRLQRFEGVDLAAPLTSVLDILANAHVNSRETLAAFLAEADNAQLFSPVEEGLEELANAAVNTLQTRFKTLVGDGLVVPDQKPLWQQSLEEIIASQKNSGGTVEGQFFQKVLGEYLAHSSFTEKRAMLASCLRLSNADSGTDVKFGALLKGAGPVFHKLMQGVSDSEIPESLKGVFADMKSNLAPIPREVVNAMLRQLVVDSKGQILKIKVLDTLGSASVGQAFLCEITDAGGQKRECVVKMLKPDVQNRFARELPLLRELALEVDGGAPGSMSKSLEGRLETIREELNFKKETEHIKEGKVYLGKSQSVGSVDLVQGVDSNLNILVMEKAEGVPLDKYLDKEIKDRIETVIGPAKKEQDITGRTFYRSETVAECIQRRDELAKVIAELGERQRQLIDLAELWFKEGVFGGGFFHGDLHAGNIMVGGKQLTVIDYGNAMKLSPADLTAMKKLVCAAGAQSPEDFLTVLWNMLESSADRDKLSLVREDLIAQLAAFFGKGDLNDTGNRLYIALNLVQRHGIEIPKAVYNFAQSQSRLQNAIEELGAKLEQAKALFRQQAPIESMVLPQGLFFSNTMKGILCSCMPLFSLKRGGDDNHFDGLVADGIKALKDDNRWEAAVNALLSAQSDAGERPEDYRFLVNEGLVVYSRSIENLPGADGRPLRGRLEAARANWAASDKTQEDAKAFMAVLREVQLELLGRLTIPEFPAQVRYGDAVQSVLLDQIGGMAKALQFGNEVGMGLAMKVKGAYKLQTQREFAESRFFKAKTTDGDECKVQYGEFVPENRVRDAGARRKYMAIARAMAFTPKALKLLGQEGWWQNEANRREFMESWLFNLTSMYKAGLRNRASMMMEHREFFLKDYGTEEEQERYLEKPGLCTQHGEIGQYEQFVRSTGDQPLEALGADIPLKFPIAFFAAVCQPGIFEKCGAMTEEERDALKQIGRDMLREMPLPSDAELDAIAKEMYDAQNPAEGESRYKLKFYQDCVRSDFKFELGRFIDDSIDFIGTGLKIEVAN